MADECTDVVTIHEEMSVFCIYMLMGGRWGTRGAFLEIVHLKKAEHLFCSSGMSELAIEFSRIIGMVLMEQVHSLERKLEFRQGL